MGIFKGTTTTVKSNKISSFDVSTAEYGAVVPEILGTTRVSGNVIYYDDFTAHEHKETQRSGKGGKSKTTTITYTYTVAVIIGLCEGEIKGIKQIWEDKEVYEYPGSSSATETGYSDIWSFIDKSNSDGDEIQLTLFKGTADQKPWAYTLGKHPDKALSYSGLAYMAGVIDLGDSGSMPNYNFEVQGKLTDTGDGIDVNPADYIRYVLDRVGLDSVEIIGLDNYRSYCKAADMLISTPSDDTDEKTAREIINEIATLTNAYVFWSNDSFKIVPLDDREYDGWTPNRTILYDLTADDFIPQSGGALVTYQRKDSSEVYNQYPVEFINRSNGYEKESVSYAMTQDIADYGLRQADTTQAHYLYTKERAVKLAEQLARNAKYGRNKYTFKLDWSFCRLEVGDLVTLTDEYSGLSKQVALIDSVIEGTDGLLTFTAVSRPPGEYTAPKYDVHENDRPYVNYNAKAPNTDKPVILQPPADLTTSGLELWIGARGTADNWGGCDVYVSDDNEHYRRAGTISAAARIGTLAKAITADDTTIQVTSNGTFVAGSKQDAERGNTLCWIDGECFSYQNATLLTGGDYQFTDCVRGQYNTTVGAHAEDSQFVRLDSAMLKIPYAKEDVGKTIYLKFVSFNIFGAGYQSLADVDAYEYTLQSYYIPYVSNLSAYNRYRQLDDGIVRYDIVVSWDAPELQSYLQGDVWYKTNHQQAENLIIKEGIAADELGFAGDWIFGGSGKNQVVLSQAIVGDTYRICCCTKDKWGASTSPDLSPSIDITVAMKSTIPNVPDGFSIAFSDAAVVSWNEVTNTDVMFYEIRKDKEAGDETEGLLARTNGLSTTVPITERSGTLYLFAKNAYGKYSDAATLDYSKAVPKTGNAPRLVSKLGGFSIECDTVPTDCIGVNIYITSAGETDEPQNVFTQNNVYSYMCGAGIYDVCYAFRDLFGEGSKSLTTTIVVKVLIDDSFIEDEAISIDKVDAAFKKVIADSKTDVSGIESDIAAIKATQTGFETSLNGLTSTVNNNATDISQLKQTDTEIKSTVATFKETQEGVNETVASQITQNASGITAIVTNLGDKDKAVANYAGIAVLSDDINLRVVKGDVINQINISDESILIDGSKVHVTGDTVFDSNVIVNDCIQAGAISADKLAATDITIGDNTITGITGGAVKLDSNGLTVTETSGSRVQFGESGMSFIDSLGNQFNTVGRFCTGQGNDGDVIVFDNPWDVVPSVFLFATQLQTSAAAYTNVNIYQDVTPINVSKKGFQIRCRSILKAGTNSNVVVNNQFANWVGATVKAAKWYEYSIDVPNGATTMTISMQMSVSSYYKSESGGDGQVSGLQGYTSAALAINKDSTQVVYEQVFSNYYDTNTTGWSTATKNSTKTIDVSGASTITVRVYFDGTSKYTYGYSKYSGCKGTATLLSYHTDVNADTVIATGSAGFIAVDPNTVSYRIGTVSDLTDDES